MMRTSPGKACFYAIGYSYHFNFLTNLDLTTRVCIVFCIVLARPDLHRPGGPMPLHSSCSVCGGTAASARVRNLREASKI